MPAIEPGSGILDEEVGGDDDGGHQRDIDEELRFVSIFLSWGDATSWRKVGFAALKPANQDLYRNVKREKGSPVARASLSNRNAQIG